jgi:hypothetical protein
MPDDTSMYHLDIVVICINRILHYLSLSYTGSLSVFTQHQDPYTIEPEHDLTRGMLQTNASAMDRPWIL